jgi:hypothetical protein
MSIPKIASLLYHDDKYKKDFVKLFNKIKSSSPVITFDQIKHTLPYTPKCVFPPGDHIGQRKLLMSEIQFLTNYKGKSKFVVYAGAAPGHKTHYLSLLFPEYTFILVDPNKFELFLPSGKTHRQEVHPDITHISNKYPTQSNLSKVKSTGSALCAFFKKKKYKIYIMEEFFTNKLAKQLKSLNSIFISDIRTGDAKTGIPGDLHIIQNTSMMFNWIMLMQPDKSLLKFRSPYKSEKDKDYFKKNYKKYKKDFTLSKKYGIDFVGDYEKGEFNFLNSVIYLQTWARVRSTETRLCVNSPLTKKPKIVINYKSYENSFHYYNTINRSFVYHVNKYASPEIGVGHCNDCAIECCIWESYIKKYKTKNTVHYYIKKIDKLLYPRTLKKVHNDLLQNPLNTHTLKKIIYADITKRTKDFKNRKTPFYCKKDDAKLKKAIDDLF